MNELLHTVEHPWSKSVVKFEHSLGCPLGGVAVSSRHVAVRTFVNLLLICYAFALAYRMVRSAFVDLPLQWVKLQGFSAVWRKTLAKTNDFATILDPGPLYYSASDVNVIVQIIS